MPTSVDPSPTRAARAPGDKPSAAYLVVTRVVFVALILIVTLLNIIGPSREPNSPGAAGLAENWFILLGAALALAVVFLVVDIVTPKRKIATLAGIAVGLVAGLIVTVVFSFVIDLVASTWELDANPQAPGALKVLLGIGFAYLGVTTVLQTKDDFRLVIPYVEFAKQIRGPRPLVLDSSVLIDARIVEIAETGLVQAPLVVPQFVVDELQTLADASADLKRSRGRRGLDVISRLQRSPGLDVTIDESRQPGKAVDQMLVALASEMPATVVTTDVGLTRVARIQGVRVVNLHDLAAALRPAVAPGEPLRVRLVREGEQPGQAVGFLEDGTMVVADDQSDRVGRHVELIVTSTIQTAGGRMIFARAQRDDDHRPAAEIGEPSRRDERHVKEAAPQVKRAARHESRPPDLSAAPSPDAPRPRPEPDTEPASADPTEPNPVTSEAGTSGQQDRGPQDLTPEEPVPHDPGSGEPPQADASTPEPEPAASESQHSSANPRRVRRNPIGPRSDADKTTSRRNPRR